MDAEKSVPFPDLASSFFSGLVLRAQTLERPDARLLNMLNYVSNFRDQMTTLERSCRRLTRAENELATDLADLGAAFRNFSMSELELAPVLQRLESTVDEQFLTQRYFVGEVETQFLDPLAEYVLYPDALKSVLKSLERQMIQMENALDALQSKRDELRAIEHPEERSANVMKSVGSAFSSFTKLLDKDPAATAQAHKAKLETTTKELEEAADKANKELTKNTETVVLEMDRFHEHKAEDVKSMLLGYTKAQIAFFDKVRW